MPAGPTINELITSCGCYSCLGLDLGTLAWLGCSCVEGQTPPTSQELLDSVTCYSCYGLSLADNLKIAAMQNILVSADPEADVSPERILGLATCVFCLGVSMGDAIQIAFLSIIASESVESPQDLFDGMECWSCFGLSTAQTLKIALLIAGILIQDPGADVSPDYLISQANCIMCAGLPVTGTVDLISAVEVVLVCQVNPPGPPPSDTCYLLWDIDPNIMEWDSGDQHILWTLC